MKTEFRKSFSRDLKRRKRDKLFLNNVKEIIEEVEKAKSISETKNLKQLKGKSAFYRIRFGDYRIGIKIKDDTVSFIRALHRKDIYRYFP
jgi:mRNA interferase RelE/StbE